MADEFKIVASLDIPKSAQAINKDIPKLQGQSKHLKIIADLDPKLSIKNIQATLNKMNNNANIKVGIDTSGLNSVQGATQNITNGLKNVQTQAQKANKVIKQVNSSLLSLKSEKLRDITFDIGSDENGYFDFQKTLDNAKTAISEIGQFKNINFSWNLDSDTGEIKKLVATITDSSGVVQNFIYDLKKLGNAFSYIGGSGNDSGIADLSIKIEETRAKYSRLLADFKSSNSAIESGLIVPINNFQTILDGLGTTHSIDNVINGFEYLKQSASEITKYLDTTNNSFNKATNAVNNYKNMNNILKDITTSFDNLVIKPSELGNELNSIKRKVLDLQELEKSEGGYTKAWAEKYREVNLELSSIKTNIELAVKAESKSQKADKNSEYQTQLKYLNKIKEETQTIVSLKKKIVNAGEEESSVYQHEIDKAQKRIKYDVQQLEKKKLLTNEALRLINTYKQEIDLQNKINTAKINDKGIKTQEQQLKSYISQLDTAITKLNTLYNSSTFTKNSSNTRVSQIKEEILQLLVDYQKLLSQLQGDITSDGLKSVDDTLTKLNARFDLTYGSAQKFETELKNDNGAEKFAQRVSILTTQIKEYQKTNSKSLKKFGSDFNEMLVALNNPNIDQQTYDKIKLQFQEIKREINATGLAGKTFFERMKEQAQKFSSWMSLTGVITSAWHEVKKMVANVIELDSCLLELSKVSDLSAEGLKSITKEAYEMGKQVGKTGTDVINAVTNFKRAGFDLKESMSFAKDALVLTNVAEGITDTGEAATALISIMKGYGDTSVEFSQKILDATNEVSNTQAINFDDLIDGSQRLSAVAKQAGVSYEQMLGILTGTNEVLQNIEKTASGQITIFTRLQGIQLPDEEDVMPIAKLQETINKATKGAVNIVDQTSGELRNVYDILNDINKVWDTLDKNTQEGIAFAAAGTRQKNVFLSMMENWKNVESATKSAQNSLGSAAIENQKRLDSISGKLANLESTFQSLSQTVVNSDLIKFIVDRGTDILNILDGIIENLGLIPTILTSIAAVKSFQNVGELLNTPVYAQPQFICA